MAKNVILIIFSLNIEFCKISDKNNFKNTKIMVENDIITKNKFALFF